MPKGSHSRYTSFIGPAKSKKYATHPWALYTEIVFIIYMHTELYTLTLPKKKKKRQQTDQMDAVAFGGLQKANTKEVACSNCLAWYLDFSENKSSSSPAVQRPSPIEAGVLCTGSSLKSSPFLFLDFSSLNGAKLAFWEGGKSFTHFSAKAPLVLWQNLAHGLFHVGSGTLFVGSSDFGGHQGVLGATNDLVVGAFSSLLCCSEREVTILSWNVYRLERVAGRAQERDHQPDLWL